MLHDKSLGQSSMGGTLYDGTLKVCGVDAKDLITLHPDKSVTISKEVSFRDLDHIPIDYLRMIGGLIDRAIALKEGDAGR